MITLYGFGPNLGQPDLSPFVMKAMILLEMAGTPYTVKAGFGALRKAPKGKLPFIDDNGTLISDSRLILRHLETTHGADFSGGYDDATLALGLMAERMLEDSSYFISLERRWGREDGWRVLEDAAFGSLPFPIRNLVGPMVRRSVRKSLMGQGTGRMSDAENDSLSAENTHALSLLLGDKPYLLGDRPCRSDATLLAFLIAGSCEAFPGAIRDAVVNQPNLCAYRDRLSSEFLAQYADKKA